MLFRSRRQLRPVRAESGGSLPNVSAYILAKDLRVKHQPICADANETLPFSGETRCFGSGSISLQRVRRQLVACGETCEIDGLRDDGVDLLDRVLELDVRIAGRQAQLEDQAVDLVDDDAAWRARLRPSSSRHHLIEPYVMGMPDLTRCWMAVVVVSRTPSTASTTTTAPSATRTPQATSSMKLMCPGVSIMLIRYDLPFVVGSTSDIGVDLSEMRRDWESECVSV